MKKIIFTTFLISGINIAYAQIYLGKECDISFFSKSPIEDIEAHNKATRPLLNGTTGELLFKIPITSFTFKSSLMQEHFNENYLESDKFPSATFQGKVNEPVDYTKEGITQVTTIGTITIHGVPKQITASGSITVSEKNVIINSVFKVHLSDFNIKVPALYSQNIPPDMDVTLNATLAPFTK